MADALTDDASRQAAVSSFFTTLGNIFGGIDSQTRTPTPTSTVDVGTDSQGNPYLRGAPASSAATTASMQGITPGMVLVIVAGLWFFKHKL